MWEKTVNFILDWAFRKLWAFLSDLYKRYKISKEIDKEEDEVQKVLAEIREYMKENKHGTRVPQHLEDKLRAATERRNSGLRR